MLDAVGLIAIAVLAYLYGRRSIVDELGESGYYVVRDEETDELIVEWYSESEEA